MVGDFSLSFCFEWVLFFFSLALCVYLDPSLNMRWHPYMCPYLYLLLSAISERTLCLPVGGSRGRWVLRKDRDST